MTEIIRSMWIDDEGQDLVEYALLVVLIALIVAASLPVVASALSSVYQRISTCLASPTGSC